jgi:2-polyprenyl-3-methyl-5-hydroxy-6-metoxy-1,4-benzoquinol methylase
MIRRHPSLDERFGARFQDQSVVDRYHLRPTYPPELFHLLSTLIVDEPRVVLDVGCGTGNIARLLAEYVDRIDAVDRSLPMLERAQTLPGGDSPRIRWLHGRAEDIVETEPPYALITAGESLHWMDWGVVLPRWSREISPHGVLAIAYVVDQPTPWSEAAQQIVRRFSTNPTYEPFNWIEELTTHHLFEPVGERETAPISVQQSAEDYISAHHARSSLSLDAMTAENALRFDAEMQALLMPFAHEGVLTLTVAGGMTWGKPKSGDAPQVL